MKKLSILFALFLGLAPAQFFAVDDPYAPDATSTTTAAAPGTDTMMTEEGVATTDTGMGETQTTEVDVTQTPTETTMEEMGTQTETTETPPM